MASVGVLANASTADGRVRPGDLDADYGTCGSLAHPTLRDVDTGSTPVARTIAGRFVVADQAGSGDVFLARFASDGSLDRSFGAGGAVTADPRTAEGEVLSVQDLAVQSDGGVVVAGSVGLANDDRSRPLLVRFTAEGKPDTAFGEGGIRSDARPAPSTETWDAVAVDASDRIVTAGSRDERFTVRRFLPDGRPDATFGANGVAQPTIRLRPAGGNDLAVLADGRILAGGFADQQFALARLQPGGAVDPTFATGGVNVASPPASASIDAVAVTPDGRIVVAGNGENINETNIALGRYTANGAIDPTFGRDGFVLEPGAAEAGAMILRPDGGILLRAAVGDSSGGVISYKSDGSRDLAFGRRGVASGNSQGRPGGMVLQPDGGLLVPYVATNQEGSSVFAIDRHVIDEPAVSSVSGQASVCGVQITSARLRDVLSKLGGGGLGTELETTQSRVLRLAAAVTVGRRTSPLITTRTQRVDAGRSFPFLLLTREARAVVTKARRARFTVTVSEPAGRRLATARVTLRR